MDKQFDGGFTGPLVLASGSPRRRRLLAELGVEFRTVVPQIDEQSITGPSPQGMARERARRKAEVVAETLNQGLVIGADTIVVCEGRVLGKPRDAADARRLLALLSGRAHRVITGVCVWDAGARRYAVAHEETEVVFCRLEPEEIERYVATGEPMDKAGAYGIQGRGALLVERICGDYFNVVGLPLVLLARLLKDFGLRLL
ncbi:MAG: septum formation inhibitor Maf [Firmicutes bacterium]|nr:septum formation inhibitor Maf [Bacillota bacterium]